MAPSSSSEGDAGGFSNTVSRVKQWLRKFGGAPALEHDAQAGSSSSSDTACCCQSPDEAEQQKQSQMVVEQPQARSSQQPAQPEERQAHAPVPRSAGPDPQDFWAGLGHNEANRYIIREVIGKGSYGIVCSAVDQFTGERVAIKKITNVFEHVSDATRILREIKLLRLLKHPDIVEIKHIMLPPSARDFKDIYVVFELMETDLHQVIKANDDLTPDHHQFFLYQMLRGLKYIHSAKVFHRDLKPKNILANSDCKLKICDFGLARPAFNDVPTAILWTDYVATRWYRAPELCGSFFAKYSPAIDIWSVGCIFAEVLLGKPLFPGKNVAHQLEIITDLLGTPAPHVLEKVRNEKARRFLMSMHPKPGIPFQAFFPNAAPAALALLKRMLAFDPAERPSAEEALADPYFAGLHSPSREPVAQPVSKMAFEFDRRKLEMNDVRQLIYQEILEYHPQVLRGHLGHGSRSSFVNPSALDNFRRQFLHLEQNPGAVIDMRGHSASGAAPGSAPSVDPAVQQYQRAVVQQFTGGHPPSQQQPLVRHAAHAPGAMGYEELPADQELRAYAAQQQQQHQAQVAAHYQQQQQHVVHAAAAGPRTGHAQQATYYPAAAHHQVQHAAANVQGSVQYMQYSGVQHAQQHVPQASSMQQASQQSTQQAMYAQAWATAAQPVMLAQQQQQAVAGWGYEAESRGSAQRSVTQQAREQRTSSTSGQRQLLQAQISAPMPALADDPFLYSHPAAGPAACGARGSETTHMSPMLIDELAGGSSATMHAESAGSQASAATAMSMTTAGSGEPHMLMASMHAGQRMAHHGHHGMQGVHMAQQPHGGRTDSLSSQQAATVHYHHMLAAAAQRVASETMSRAM